MYARVAEYEGEPDGVRAAAAEINKRAESGPPEGMPASSFMLLVDEDRGRALGIALFDTEEDLRKGHEVANRMTPPAGGMRRTGTVGLYEVAVDVRA